MGKRGDGIKKRGGWSRWGVWVFEKGTGETRKRGRRWCGDEEGEEGMMEISSEDSEGCEEGTGM